MKVNESTQSARWAIGLTTSLCSAIFISLWAGDITNAWLSCYISTIALSCTYLWMHRRNLVSLSSVFVGLSLIAITLPAVPYLVFDLEPPSSFYPSLFLNSLGLLLFVSFAFYLSPYRGLYQPSPKLFAARHWATFVYINGLICFFTFPLVILAITKAGAWSYLLGDRSGDFDRIASMKGLGPLMIFSVVNVMALLFWAAGSWLKGRKWRVLVVVALVLFFNGFTGGRQNLIAFFLGALVLYSVIKGLNKRGLAFVLLIGTIIVFMKVLRVGGNAEEAILPWYVTFFLQFVGDFDSVNNVSVLIDYIGQHDYFGFFHIWSNILVYVPRELFPSKPHDIGGLYLNTFLFPGVYLGADGGTGLALGFQGLMYAAYGIPTLVMGNLVLAFSLGRADRQVSSRLHLSKPGYFLVAYIFLMGQSIITYREGFYSFLNTAFYVSVYYFFFKSIQLIITFHESSISSRPLEAPRGKEYSAII